MAGFPHHFQVKSLRFLSEEFRIYQYLLKSPLVRKHKTVKDSGFQIADSGFQVMNYMQIPCQWNLDSRFQSLADFGIPWAE